jgi:predicted TIM-barrel fold metal-dependent hydrolase
MTETSGHVHRNTHPSFAQAQFRHGWPAYRVNMELAQTWQPYADAAIDAFGPARCMMESNYPPDGRAAGFVPLWNALKHMVRGASAAEKAVLFQRTAARVYGLPGYD